VVSGTGSITVRAPSAGAARLILTNRSTYSVPAADQIQYAVAQGHGPTVFDGVTFPNATSAVYVTHHVNPPVLYVEPGATVQLGSKKHLPPGGMPAEIFSQASSHATAAGSGQNFDNIQNNGLLVVNSVADSGSSSSWPHLGGVSGCGDLRVDGSSAGSMAFSGVSTYTGNSIFYATNIGDGSNFSAIPNTNAIFNAFVLVFSTPIRSYYAKDDGVEVQRVTPAIEADPSYFGAPGALKIAQKIYGSHHGNSIHNLGRGGVDVFTGSYSYSDSGDQTRPSLSDPTLDFTAFNGNASHRIFYLHGASITQFGDGTTSDLFAKGNEVTVTLSLQGDANLGLFYAGTVPFDLLINSPAKVEGGDFFIMGAAGQPENRVVLTQPAYYNGATHIDANAVLQLGDGTPGNSKAVKVKPTVGSMNAVDGTYSTSGGNGIMLTPGTGDGTGANSVVGTATNLVIDNGQLVVDETPGALDGIGQVTLSHISGSGSVTQMGSLPLTLLGGNTYSGGTKINAGTLLIGDDAALGKGPLVNDGSLATTSTQHVVNIAGDFTQAATGRLGLTFTGMSTDSVKVAGRATLGGSLSVTAAGGFAPAVGQKFNVVQASGGLSGTFVSLQGNGIKLVASYDATTAFVTVVP
jgi:autotransporter-associated beta strand protein